MFLQLYIYTMELYSPTEFVFNCFSSVTTLTDVFNLVVFVGVADIHEADGDIFGESFCTWGSVINGDTPSSEFFRPSSIKELDLVDIPQEDDFKKSSSWKLPLPTNFLGSDNTVRIVMRGWAETSVAEGSTFWMISVNCCFRVRCLDAKNPGA